ncbi:MAG: BMP family lipoprotein, partial [Bdellovibrionota bacterium]
SSASAAIRVGLVLDKGGKDDRGFNAAAFAGLERAKDALHVEVEAVEAQGDAGHEPLLRQFAKKGFDLVLALGQARAGALQKVAAEYPKVKFGIVDGEVKARNVRSILFEEQEGSYLVGAIAAMVSKSGSLGFIGGMDIPVIRRYLAGFTAGAKRMKPSVKVTSQYIGTSGTAWNDRPRARTLADAQFTGGADIVFAVSGGSNLGVFDSAEAQHHFAIGVSNQNWVKPGIVLTSMRKRVDIAVFMTIQDTMTGGFSGGTKHYGLESQGVDFVVDENNEKLLPEAILTTVEELKADIIAHKIQVPSK